MDYPVIEAADLSKSFGGTPAVVGIDLEVPRGTVHALLGPDGAGKTTTIRMLAALLRPDFGRAWVFGHDVVREADAVRARIGPAGRSAAVDGDLTGRENLVLAARLPGHPRPRARDRADELLEAFELTGAPGQVKAYPGELRRRLDIAAGIVTAPDLLFLDEPTTGLDPRGRHRVRDAVRAIAAQGSTVLLTTRCFDEADRLADRIAVIDRGRIVAEGTGAELKAPAGLPESAAKAVA